MHQLFIQEMLASTMANYAAEKKKNLTPTWGVEVPGACALKGAPGQTQPASNCQHTWTQTNATTCIKTQQSFEQTAKKAASDLDRVHCRCTLLQGEPRGLTIAM